MYKVKYGGKKGKTINLVESPDMVVIRTKDNRELENVSLSRKSREMIESTQEVVSFPDAGVSIRRMKVDTELESAAPPTMQRDATRSQLNTEDNIRFAGRVLQDAESGEATLYTENFFVKFKDDVSEADCENLIKEYNLKIKNKLPFAPNSYFVQAQEGTGLEVFNIAENILAEKIVEYCHPELVQERKFKARHPLQWHLAKTVIDGKTVDAHCNIEGAWKHSRGAGVTIAVIDDGVDIDHPEFAGRVVHPFDASENSQDPRPKFDDDNHGTPCAGMACAAGLPDGASGTAPEAKLMPIRLRSGLGSMSEAMAFAWAADHGADVISCSWGPTDGKWWDIDDPVHKRLTALPDSTRLAFDYALTKGRGGKGSVILFAAGNGNEDTKFDGYASYPGVIAVAACNDTGKRSVYSDFGAAIWVSFPSNDHGWKPFRHPAPVNEGLRTTDRTNAHGDEAGNYTNSFGGTSGACPGVAGIVGLMLAVNPALSPAEVKDLLRQSCQKIDNAEGEYDSKGHSVLYGYGRVDAALAVENALKAAKPAKGVAPSIEGTVKFVTKGEQQLQPGGALTGNFEPPKKILGFKFKLKSANRLKLRYKANVPGKGILESDAEGAYVGAVNGRQRVIGFALQLEGAGAGQYELEYTARFQGETALKTAKNGAFCGTDKKTGKTIQAISVTLREK